MAASPRHSHSLKHREVKDESPKFEGEDAYQAAQRAKRRGGEKKTSYYYINYTEFLQSVIYHHNIVQSQLEKLDKAVSLVYLPLPTYDI